MHSPSIKTEVRKLRKDSGLTFNEIIRSFPFLSKGTISKWVHDIQLNPAQEKRIIMKELGGRAKLLECNKLKHVDAVKRAELIIKKAETEIGKLSRRDLLIAGIALYWAEGYVKSEQVIEVANSNPKIILLMMRFFRSILGIKEHKFRCGLILHPNLDQDSALQFWSELTGIPLKRFHKTYIKPPKSSTGKMHNILYKGTVKIRICDKSKLSELKGLVRGLGNEFEI